jgi:hypothetical protein
MTKLVLRPCRVRSTFFSTEEEDPVTYDLKQLRNELTNTYDRLESHKISMLQQDAYIGSSQTATGNKIFVLINPDKSGNIAWVLAKDPSFRDRILKVYKVQSIDWGSQIEEQNFLGA